MSTLTQHGDLPVKSQTTHWSLATRITFRFCFVYFGLYCLSNQIIQGVFPIPKIDQPDYDSLWPARAIIIWVGTHILRLKTPLAYVDSGSGDRSWDWVVAFMILVTALLTTVIWSVLDRKRDSYQRMYQWFLLFVRFCLASQLLIYGISKIVRFQMQFPPLFIQVEPFGNLSPMGILWESIGASPAYETFTGCAEFVGGLLLIFPRTATLGALIALADMVQVFVLNMTYDVPVKLLSFHLILLSLLLLAPEWRRLADFFFFHRAIEADKRAPLFRSVRANRIALASQTLLWLWILGNVAYSPFFEQHQFGRRTLKPPLYGIWNVSQYVIDGQIRAPLITDSDNWRRVILEFSDLVVFQKTDDSRVSFPAAIDTKLRTISLTKRDDKNWHANLTFNQPSSDQLSLDGTMAGHRVEFHLTRLDHTKFLFASRGFHWVQERPFNR